MLKSQTNNKSVLGMIKGLILDDERINIHGTVQANFEHEQWYVSCLNCGAAWAIVDVNKGVNELDIEEISEGDGYCYNAGA